MLKLSNNLSLPVDLTGKRTAVFGISGGGKSNTASVIIEEAAESGEQFVLIDHKGEAWGLLSDAKGKPSGLDVIIFGEPGGHIKTLTEHHGAQIADFVVESGRSVAISLAGFPSDGAERRFVANFLRELYRRKQNQTKRSRVLVIFEEAHLFVPESAGRGFKGDAAELAGACQRIVRQGRSFGIGSLIVDQRPQDVAKRVVTQCDTIICHRLTHPLDKKVLAEWIACNASDEQGKQFLDSLPSLKDGEAWIWSPKIDIFKKAQIRRRHTYDSGSAPDESSAVTVKRKEIDIAALNSDMAKLAAEAKANDPGELKRRVAELERQAKAKPAAAADPAAIERARASGFSEGQKAALAALKERDSIISRLTGRLTKGAWLATELAGKLSVNGEAVPKVELMNKLPTPNKFIQKSDKSSGNVHTSAPTLNKSRPINSTINSSNIASSEGLTKTQQRILDVVATLNARGIPANRDCVARWQAIHPNGGRYGSDLAELRAQGYLNGFELTELGESSAHAQRTGAEGVLAALQTGTQQKLFSTILENAGETWNRDTLAAELGIHPNGGRYGSDLAWLRTMGVITERGPIEATAGAER